MMHFNGLMELYCRVEVVIRIGMLENRIIIDPRLSLRVTHASQWVGDMDLLQATNLITNGEMFLVMILILDIFVREIKVVRYDKYCW